MAMRRLVMWLLVLSVAVFILVLSTRARQGEPEAPPAAQNGFALISDAFADGGPIPALYTADGRNISPPLAWQNVPDGTVSFALIMEDPDAPLGIFVHWVICDMPAVARSLPEDIPHAETVPGKVRAIQGTNSFHKAGYGGPDPPKGKPHRYVFTLYALDETVDLPGGLSKRQLQAAMKGHELGRAGLTGVYGRQ